MSARATPCFATAPYTEPPTAVVLQDPARARLASCSTPRLASSVQTIQQDAITNIQVAAPQSIPQSPRVRVRNASVESLGRGAQESARGPIVRSVGFAPVTEVINAPESARGVVRSISNVAFSPVASVIAVPGNAPPEAVPGNAPVASVVMQVPTLPPELTNAIFNSIDRDKDGFISRKDYEKFLSGRRSTVHAGLLSAAIATETAEAETQANGLLQQPPQGEVVQPPQQVQWGQQMQVQLQSQFPVHSEPQSQLQSPRQAAPRQSMSQSPSQVMFQTQPQSQLQSPPQSRPQSPRQASPRQSVSQLPSPTMIQMQPQTMLQSCSQPQLVPQTQPSPRKTGSVLVPSPDRRVTIVAPAAQESPRSLSCQRTRRRVSILAQPRARQIRSPERGRKVRGADEISGKMLIAATDDFFASTLRRNSVDYNDKVKVLIKAPPSTHYDDVKFGVDKGKCARPTIIPSSEEARQLHHLYHPKKSAG